MADTLKLTLLACLPSAILAEEVRQCAFENEPVGLGHFWDPSCEEGQLGCFADGVNLECRYCGAGDFVDVQCPPSSCHFPSEPYTPYYWDSECEMGKLGCWADGVHAQCRFCGDHPFAGIPCPDHAAPAKVHACNFTNEPANPYYWDSKCALGGHGCNADGNNVECRFCGGDGIYADIPCPAGDVCHFAAEPSVPYFWDESCEMGMLGCFADGVHLECRFCAHRPFESISCPAEVAPANNTCTFPLHDQPDVPFFWDPTCEMGMIGCWADGFHAECRFCGVGDYADVACPTRRLRASETMASSAEVGSLPRLLQNLFA